MGLTSNDYQHQVNALLPRGPIWQRTAGSVLDAVLYALEREAARIDGRACAALEESDPRTSIEELAQWFSDYGIPSQCLAAISDPSQEQMRQELIAKITSNLGLTPAFFKSLAAALGYDAEVETYQIHSVADAVDDPLRGPEWTVAMTLGVRVKASGDSNYLNVMWNASDPLARWGNALLECVIKALAPAHVYVIFSYEDDEND